MKRTDLIELLQQPTETLAVEIKRWLSPDEPIEAAKIARSNSSGHGALDHPRWRTNNPEDWFRRIPIKTKKIVHRVIAHPRATKKTKLAIDGLLRRYLQCRRREDSALEI